VGAVVGQFQELDEVSNWYLCCLDRSCHFGHWEHYTLDLLMALPFVWVISMLVRIPVAAIVVQEWEMKTPLKWVQPSRFKACPERGRSRAGPELD
jgi:hypothetical protein